MNSALTAVTLYASITAAQRGNSIYMVLTVHKVVKTLYISPLRIKSENELSQPVALPFSVCRL